MNLFLSFETSKTRIILVSLSNSKIFSYPRMGGVGGGYPLLTPLRQRQLNPQKKDWVSIFLPTLVKAKLLIKLLKKK